MQECAEKFCNLPVRSRGFCATHYNQRLKGIEPQSRDFSPFPECAVSHCDLEANARKEGSLCPPHYQKKWRGVDPETYVIPENHPRRTAPECREPECRRRSVSSGYCGYHRLRAKIGRASTSGFVTVRDACKFESCEIPIEFGGYCKSHADQLQRGEELRPIRAFGVYTNPTRCPIPKCRGHQAAMGLCQSHHGMRRKYQLTVEQMIEVWTNPACSNPGCGETKRLHMDHDHETGKFRALLCSPCNTAFGFLKENIARIEGLAEYKRMFG